MVKIKSNTIVMLIGYYLEIFLFIFSGFALAFNYFIFSITFIVASLVSFWVGHLIKKKTIENYQEQQIYIKKSINKTLTRG